jgi:hypothetical protein
VRVSLFFNKNAGDGVTLDHIRDAIEQRGHELVRVIENRTNMERLLEERPDIVVAAGGDGTIAHVARLLAHRGIPLAILPLGTANNIAKSVGITASIEDVIGGWETPPPLTSRCARQVTLQGTTDIHVDDEVLLASAHRTVSIRVEAGALELLA